MIRALLLALLLLPATALASEPEQREQVEADSDRSAWRPTMLRTLDHHGRPWGMASGALASVATHAWMVGALQLADDPGCPGPTCSATTEFVVGLVALGFAVVPSIGVLPTIGLLRLAVQHTRLEPRRFRRRLVTAGTVVFLSAGAVGTLSLVLNQLAIHTYTSTGEVAVAAAVTMAVLLQVGASLFTLAEAGRRWEAKQRPRARRPAPRLVAAGPTGLILRF